MSYECYKASLIVYCIFASLCTQNLAAFPTSQVVTQWVLIDSTQYNDGATYHVDVKNLDATYIKCGKDCKQIKLSTTPFSTQGIMRIDFNGQHCSNGGKVELPFSLNAENVLATPEKTYEIVLSSNWCPFEYVDVKVTKSADNSKGYLINLKSK